ncbi:MAG TPA: glycoside hydrolase family 15 protein [Acidimicrobiia bacterium]|nr:glycoside hydrolase family 15 protein [Acidimicrobiia bacterium]
MTDLVARSISLILDNQAASGAYPAAVDYPTYRDCWFRDGSYIAYSMDLTGHPESASRFHQWVADAVLRRADTVDKAIEHQRNGVPLDSADLLHTRYTLQGQESDTDWPNFQLDGLGTWLWALREHHQTVGEAIPGKRAEAADLVTRYLTALWEHPCYDCWEEFPDQIHTHTLAAIHGGLTADQVLFDRDHTQTLDSIREVILRDAVIGGHFTKYLGHDDIDTSLVGLATPYQVVDANHPAFLRTVHLIETRLRHNGGGPRRYPTDTFYGGGEWVVLAGWLAWHHAQAGNDAAAHQLRDWIEAQADPAGNLPEQVPHHLNAPDRHQEWVDRWGPIAQPLLWSHANYLIVKHHIKGA